MRTPILLFLPLLVFISCNNKNAANNSPTTTAKAFLDASQKGDIDNIKNNITAADVAFIETASKTLSGFDLTQLPIVKNKIGKEFKKPLEGVSFDLSNEKISNDSTATVDVRITKNTVSKTHPFTLLKEKGQWKVSLFSTGLNETGMTKEQMEEKLAQMQAQLDRVNGIKDTFMNKIKELKNISSDSLSKIISKGAESLEKIAEALEK